MRNGIQHTALSSIAMSFHDCRDPNLIFENKDQNLFISRWLYVPFFNHFYFPWLLRRLTELRKPKWPPLLNCVNYSYPYKSGSKMGCESKFSDGNDIIMKNLHHHQADENVIFCFPLAVHTYQEPPPQKGQKISQKHQNKIRLKISYNLWTPGEKYRYKI